MWVRVVLSRSNHIWMSWRSSSRCRLVGIGFNVINWALVSVAKKTVANDIIKLVFYLED